MNRKILVLSLALGIGSAVNAQKLERLPAPPPPPPAVTQVPPAPQKIAKSKRLTTAERIKAKRLRALQSIPPPPPPAIKD